MVTMAARMNRLQLMLDRLENKESEMVAREMASIAEMERLKQEEQERLAAETTALDFEPSELPAFHDFLTMSPP